jgi:AraC-like DNA-binding protein
VQGEPATPAPEFAPFRLSTDDLPERDRMAVWREVIGRTLLKVDIAPLPDQPFRAELVGGQLPGLAFMSETSTGRRIEKTRDLVAADGNDDIIMGVHVTGSTIASQHGREAAVGERSAVLMSNAETGHVIYPAASRHIGLVMPRRALAPLVPGLEDALIRPIPPDNEALRLLMSYIGVLGGLTLTAPELQRLVAAHVHDLVALIVGASREAAAVAAGRGVRAARLAAIKADIAANLRQSELTVSTIATRQRVSTRYVQMLFEAEGTTFSQYVISERLAVAHRLLTDPRTAGRTIAAIAIEAGFRDLSYFNRTFRRRYGVSPSDVREEAHCE